MAPTMTPARPTARTAPNGKQGAKAAPVLPRPFVAGTRPTDEADYDDTATLTTSSQRLDPYEVSPNGFLGAIWVIVEGTTAGNAAAVTFSEDGPFNVLDTVTLKDTNNQGLVGPLGGYDLYVIDKYGGYTFQGDPKASPVYSATEGGGATGGSFAFILNIPVELVHRDALGSLPNTSGSAQFSVDFVLAASATLYGVVPTNAASVRVRTVLGGWQDPNPTDITGHPVAQNPPAPQTTQYWHKQTYDIASGSFDRKLQSVDGYARALVFINRRSSSTRANGDADWPDPFTFQYEKNLVHDARPRILWRHWIASYYGYDAAAETGGDGSSTGIGGRDLGVYPLFHWMLDFFYKPGAETRFGYLPISDATNLAIKGTFSNASSLTLLVNKVNVVGDPKSLTQR